MVDNPALDEAKHAIERIQHFDVNRLPRIAELGERFAFDEAVQPAQEVVELFRKVPADALTELPQRQLNELKDHANSVYSLFDEIANFDNTQAEAMNARTNILNQVKAAYQQKFPILMPYISYGVARTVDFARLESDGRAVLQDIKDKTNGALEEIEKSKAAASDVLAEIKKSAAEHGVTQQAIFFERESTAHDELANTWRGYTRNWAIAIIGYGILSFFLHKIPVIRPTTVAETIAFVASKLLIFAILSYMLILSARNFLSHKHNAVVNKHRQNALMTFNALVAAGGTKEAQDIILGYASACIFSPQDTGYTKHGGPSSSQMPNFVELIPKTNVKLDG